MTRASPTHMLLPIKFLSTFFVLLFTTLSLPSNSLSKCTMTSPGIYFDKTYPTVPNEEPLQLPQSHFQILADICPHLVGNETAVDRMSPHQEAYSQLSSLHDPIPSTFCCNVSQIDILKDNFRKIDASFNKCPACAESMKRMWCDFTCSNKQADFVEVQSLTPPENKWVKEARFVLSMTFQDEFWQCCKRNILGQVYIENQYVNVRAFLPGIVGEQQPPPNPLVAFKFLNKDEKYPIPAYDGETVPCDTSCTCQYCEDACNNPKYRPLTPDYSCRMFGIKCYIVFIVSGCVMSLLVGFACAWGITGRVLSDRASAPRTSTQKADDDDVSHRRNTAINSTPDVEASFDDSSSYQPHHASVEESSCDTGGRLFNPGIRDSVNENSALLDRRRI
mmetsp:Transcript_9960/g.37157  ORF Transcript_9960/g.37157 Transcript_9960/m.37157 type:complete len:391 (+) Transcript_9960:2-1174(+)